MNWSFMKSENVDSSKYKNSQQSSAEELQAIVENRELKSVVC